MVVNYGTQLEVQNCINCGITFGLPVDYDRRLRETHKNFYCPNGHPQQYTGLTEAEKLRKELAQEQHRREQVEAERTRMREQRDAAERRASAARGQTTKLKNRASNGVCPCCNRSFENLRRHMETKHPDFAKS